MENTKVMVELYSEEPLENVMAMLKYKPEKIIFLGHKYNMITRKINNIKNFRDRKCPEVELEFIEVPKDDLNATIEIITAIIRENPGVRFELTGGSELILIAIGVISARMEISKLRIDPFTGKEIEIKGSEVVTSDYQYDMNIADDIVLHGGMLTDKTGSISEWKFTREFRGDIIAMWDICRKYKGDWNKHCSKIEELMKHYPSKDEGWFDFGIRELGTAILLLRDLVDDGLVKNYREEQKRVRFRFKSNMVKKVIAKAGNILELHVYEVATREAYLYSDAVIGAHIDWNGEIHDANNPGYDTMNEIDVILMKNVCPIFISCKSGKAGGLALHELETVSRKFAGKYARKALVLSRACDDTTGTMFFKQRAKDMHIWIIDDVFRMSDEQLLNRLKRI
ncbi:MAG: hypothetical protein J5962_04390 [Lachnospiraceae bacterium]|nr:hypothetical protein [Lachnospiraceae bacterium]